jgi:hypothetical protein
MSLSATCAAFTREPAETRKLLLLLWGLTVATYLLAGGGVPKLSTDDAMRLVEVRDLLAGQGWFDLTQHRLNPPDGAAMHWSRLVDVPIALLVRLGQIALPAAQAERLPAVIWPAAVLLAFFAGIVWLVRALACDAAARLALIFAALTAPVLQHFRPGALDHHNVQLALLVWTIALTIRWRPRETALAGVFCALSLAVGQEMAPSIAILAAVPALRWATQGEAGRHATAAFAAAFAAATLALFAATVPPARYAVPTCDALSIMQVLVAVIGGGGLAMLTATPIAATAGRRLVALAGLGSALALTVGLGFPACLGDPYAHLDARLTALWLSNVNEARSIAGLMRDLPQEVLAYYGLPMAGLVLGLMRCARETGDRRWGFIAATAVLAVATLIAFWQVRGCATANAIALALVPAALVARFPAADGRAIFLGLGRAALIAAAVLNPLALIAIGKAAVWTAERTAGLRRPTVVSDGPGTCSRAADYTALAQLPRGRVLAFIDAGPFLLMETPHSVFAAPYHRNAGGNAAMLDLFLGRPDGAWLAALNVDYVAFCPGAPERHNYAAAAPDGLAAVLGRGETPDFLERIPLERTDLVLYRRRP